MCDLWFFFVFDEGFIFFPFIRSNLLVFLEEGGLGKHFIYNYFTDHCPLNSNSWSFWRFISLFLRCFTMAGPGSVLPDTGSRYRYTYHFTAIDTYTDYEIFLFQKSVRLVLDLDLLSIQLYNYN